jgi:hypothetical protein
MDDDHHRCNNLNNSNPSSCVLAKAYAGNYLLEPIEPDNLDQRNVTQNATVCKVVKRNSGEKIDPKVEL